MASDTNIKKTDRPARPSIDTLMDLYWGGSERRITGLTLRILLVNILALLIFMLGLIQFSQYQTDLLATKLESFQKEALTLAQTISRLDDNLDHQAKYITAISRDVASITGHEIVILNNESEILFQTTNLSDWPQVVAERGLKQSLAPLRWLADFVIRFLPNTKKMPLYPESDQPQDFPDIKRALAGTASMSAWQDPQNKRDIILSGAVPIIKQKQRLGIVYIVRSAADIRKDVQNFWIQMLQIFMLNFAIMLMISIYLAGSIARPLRSLTRAAEQIRRSKAKSGTIPNLSARLDEIGELSLVMRDMTESLQERLGTIERFVADVAHEIKNPLTSMKSAAETLKGTKKKENQDKLLAVMQHDIERMDRLISDISTASKLDAALYHDVLAPLDIDIMLRGIVQRYQQQYNPKILFDYNPPVTKGWAVLGLESRIHQVIDNILMNAISFSKEGDVIHLNLLSAGDFIELHIMDQGRGIPEGKLETIFDRFYSERPQSESFGKHSGLGLSICRQIMSALGGHIRAENIKTRTGETSGARFVISFVKAV